MEPPIDPARPTRRTVLFSLAALAATAAATLALEGPGAEVLARLRRLARPARTPIARPIAAPAPAPVPIATHPDVPPWVDVRLPDPPEPQVHERIPRDCPACGMG